MNTRRMARVVALVLVVVASLCTHAQSQDEMNQEACGVYRKDDAELNRVYQQILTEYKADAVFVAKLRRAQRAWIAFRDTQIEALYSAVDPRGAYGSVYQMCRCSALTELTLSRTEELRRWVKGLEAGDVCAGSIKIRGYDGRIRPRPMHVTGTKSARKNRYRVQTRSAMIAAQ